MTKSYVNNIVLSTIYSVFCISSLISFICFLYCFYCCFFFFFFLFLKQTLFGKIFIYILVAFFRFFFKHMKLRILFAPVLCRFQHFFLFLLLFLRLLLHMWTFTTFFLSLVYWLWPNRCVFISFFFIPHFLLLLLAKLIANDFNQEWQAKNPHFFIALMAYTNFLVNAFRFVTLILVTDFECASYVKKKKKP